VGVAHEAVSRRPPIPLYTIVAPYSPVRVRREGLGFVHHSRTIFCRPRAKPYVTILQPATFAAFRQRRNLTCDTSLPAASARR
jgi:hypothetical protein